jgi:hypothetical protein
LKEKKLSILANAKSSEKEMDSLLKVINEIHIESTVLLLSLKNKNDFEFAKAVLLEGFRAIFVIPYGILKFELQKSFPNNWDENRILVISTTTPDQNWRIYESSNVLKFRQKLTDVTLINSLDLKAIDSLVKYLKKPLRNIYYINYWYNGHEVFNNLQAKKIGINNNTGKVKIAPLLNELENS